MHVKNAFFPDARAFAVIGKKLLIDSKSKLSPLNNQDFLLTFWVKLTKNMKNGESLVIIEKYNPEIKTKPGYSIVVRKDEGEIRPVVYWNDKKGNGKWFVFPSLSGFEKSWTLFALSYTKSKYLGLQVATRTLEGSPNFQNLGGYELVPSINPSNSSELGIGSLARGAFKGKYGPLGILSVNDIGENYLEKIKNLAKSPLSFLDIFKGADILLWTDNLRVDKSAYNAKIITINRKKSETVKK